MAKKHQELGNKNISNLLLKLSLPSMVAMFANAIYNIIDTIFVGRGIDAIAIGAVAIVLPIMAIASSFAHLIGIGTATLLSRTLGAGNEDKTNKITGNGFLLSFLTGIVFAVSGLIFTDPLLKIFGATPGILPYAHDFAKMIFIGMLWFPFCVSTSNYLRAEGRAKEAMNSMLIGLILNVILDYIFIFPMNMGITGAGLATILGKFATFIYLILYFTGSKTIINFNIKYFRLNKEILKPTFKVGLSGFGMRSSSSIANVALNHSLGFYGGDMAISIFGIIYKVTLFLAMPMFGFNQGMQPIVGYNFGAEKYNRILKTIKLGFTYSVIYGVVSIFVFELFTEDIFSLFTNDPALIDHGVRAMRIVVSMMWLMGISTNTMGIHQAMGKSKPAFIVAILRWVLLIMPLIFILPSLLNPGLDGIWFSFPIADLLAAVISILILRYTLKQTNILYKWKTASD
jgi:putative MATE family efflux protein